MTEETEDAPLLPKGLTAEMLAELKVKYSELRVIDNGDVGVVVKQPNRPQWERFQQVLEQDGKKKHRALEELLSACTVWPDATGLNAIFDRRPAYILKFGMQLVAFAAGDNEVEKKDV
jgi:hypothetical protein